MSLVVYTSSNPRVDRWAKKKKMNDIHILFRTNPKLAAYLDI